MERWFQIDWAEIFIPTHSLAEIIVRGTMIYIILFILLRFLLKRQSGAIGIADLLVVVLIADAAQNAMANDYKSVTEGALLVVTIIAWDYALDWLGYQFPAFQRLMRPGPLLLIKNGKTVERNMRRELITADELMSQLRQQGVDAVGDVKKAFMEGDGHVSVIKNDGSQNTSPRRNEAQQ